MLSDTLTTLVAEAAVAAGHGDSPVPLEPCVPTNNPEHGDYQSNYAFRLGKAKRTNPRAVAEAMVAAIPANDVIRSAEVAGPGFINFWLTDEALLAEVETVAAGHGIPQRGADQTLVIDFSSPNVAKRMHVGHLRSTIIGDALHRIYESLGWQVIADNHIGDWGTQFGKLIVAWHRWKDEAAYAADPIAELQRLYQKFGTEAENDPTMIDEARAETARLQAGDAENLALWTDFVTASLREFDAVYARLGISFDETLGESAYRDELQALIDQMLADGIAVDSEGAVIVPFEPSDGKGLAKSPLLIRKSDGAALYGTTDLATIRHRQQTWNPDRVVYVVDTRQQLHFRQVFAAARKLGFTGHLEHVWFGMLRFPGGKVASTRSGGTINLVDVLDEARDRARAVVDEKSPHLSETDKQSIAESVGVGAVKYFDLSQNPQTDITFDWDRSLALTGNTAPYIQYAHARCHSILGKSDQRPGPLVLTDPAERALALAIARFPESVLAAAEVYRPNLVAEQLFIITDAFGKFYSACRVLGVPEEPGRLALTAATAAVVRQGLDLLGIDAPERM